jgi:DNA-binding transcriptional LysR family regulator
MAGHRVVGGPAGSQSTSWQFERDGTSLTVEVTPTVSANDTAGALAAVASGLGISSTTSWACQLEIEAGSLVRLFPEWKMSELPVHAYFPMGRATRMAARAFVDYLVKELNGQP